MKNFKDIFTKSKKVIFVSLIVLISFLFTIIFYFNYVVVNVQTLDMHVNITDGHLGFNADSDKMYFGSVSGKGSSISERRVFVENNNDFPVKIDVFLFGDLKDYVYIIEGGVTELNSGESGYLYYRFYLDDVILEDGEYTGITRIFLRRIFS